MPEEHIENGVPARDEAPSPTESVKDDGHNFRLLIVANRLPITIKKQPGVRFPIFDGEHTHRVGRI
jgi:hypothetical protein